MTDKPTDAVAQARANIHLDLTMSSEADVDALIAAVEARCAAKVRAVPTIGNTPSDAQFFADKMRDKILAALEAP